MPSKKISVVLAHGAWADGSSWSSVIPILYDQGANVIAAPLPLTSLADDVAAVGRSLEQVEGPAVLVGHAYAGAVIAEVRSDQVKSLVYVAALAPEEGETVADVFYRASPHPMAPALAPDKNGLIWLPREAFGRAFAPNASTREQEILFALQRPISPACITVPVKRPLWKDRPSWYLLAEDDHMIIHETQYFMAERMKAEIRPHSVDHTPSVTAPKLVADVIMEAARSA